VCLFVTFYYILPQTTSNLDASAPRFMKSIYNTLDELGIPRDSQMDPAQRDVLERADTVVTFTSKGGIHLIFLYANRITLEREFPSIK